MPDSSIRLDKYEVERGEAASYFDAGANDPARLPVTDGSVGYPGFSLETGEDRNGYGFYIDLATKLTEALGVYTAVRTEDFDEFGTLNNGQIALTYEFSDKLQVRLGAAGGDRAPSIAQQAYSRTLDTLQTGGTSQSGVYRPDSALAAVAGRGGARCGIDRQPQRRIHLDRSCGRDPAGGRLPD